MSILKIYLIDISEYCCRCVGILRERERQRSSRKNDERKNKVVDLEAEKEVELQFYKKENRKLEERITSLFDINSKLKAQLTKKSP